MTTRSARQDAANRARRTLVQGLAIDVAVAVAAVLLAWLPDADLASREAWVIVGVSVAKSALTAVASWVMRLKLDGRGLTPGDPTTEQVTHQIDE